MSRHPFRKSFGLTVLYSIIIIGIFVLQFRNESVLSKNTGLLSVSMAQSQAEDGTLSLKNTLKINFKGISFTADEVHPALLSTAGTTAPLTLVSYEQPTNLSYKFNFTGDASLTFAVSDATPSASLSVTARVPENSDSIILNYKPGSGFSVTNRTKTKLQLNSKNLSYIFTASQISDETIIFTSKNSLAACTKYDPTETFTFASIDGEMAISQKQTYDSNIRQFKSNLISAVSSGIQSSASLSEKAVIAYVAELASQGRYTEAVNYVPDSFKKGNKRTYLSSPYFNTLESMYPSLAMHNENMDGMISNAVSTSSLNIFTVENLADYLNILSSVEKLNSVLSLPAKIISKDDSALTLDQATGILRTYLRLSELHSNYAEQLSSVIENCVSVIEGSCVINDSSLTLQDKEQQPATPLLSLEAGSALIQLGDFTASEDYKKAGYAIVNTVLAATSFDANALGDAYPVLISNISYPHYAVLHRTETSTIWAWTCAKSITYSLQNDVATISVKYNKGDSHYLILNQIPSFSEIEIYGLSFHSDPRFEQYNSSGFIYKPERKALFLKTRHKAESEIVRLTFSKNAPAEAKKAAPAAPIPQKEAKPAPAPEASAAAVPAPKAESEQPQQQEDEHTAISDE